MEDIIWDTPAIQRWMVGISRVHGRAQPRRVRKPCTLATLARHRSLQHPAGEKYSYTPLVLHRLDHNHIARWNGSDCLTSPERLLAISMVTLAWT
ncbi:MAG: hypothetical protein Q4Q03_00170 [Bowdeniella nasicola]|nr:hypothetical protein [Bowdeniella nasicola]